jgi:hypothetical protein
MFFGGMSSATGAQLLAAVPIWGHLLAFDMARIVTVDVTRLLSIAGSLVLPYALAALGRRTRDLRRPRPVGFAVPGRAPDLS